jgi:hypothetical protein
MSDRRIARDEAQLRIVRRVLQDRPPDHKILIFASRAAPSPKPLSDLVIIDPPEISEMAVALIKLDFEESDLPFEVNVSVWSQLPISLRGRIDQGHMVLGEGGRSNN